MKIKKRKKLFTMPFYYKVGELYLQRRAASGNFRKQGKFFTVWGSLSFLQSGKLLSQSRSSATKVREFLLRSGMSFPTSWAGIVQSGK